MIPSLESANLSQTNWLFCDNVAKHHNVETWSEAHLEILKEYLRNQLDLRNDYLMIPAGKPVCDEMGKVVDFDFTEAEIVGNLALEMGMKYITGGFAIKWKVWNLPQLYLKWNELDVKTEEAQRQLHLYYKRCSECLKRNGWGEKYLARHTRRGARIQYGFVRIGKQDRESVFAGCENQRPCGNV